MVAAVASYLDARSQGGRWHLRIEDVDRTRAVAGAAEDIQRTLEAFALTWDGPVIRQSANDELYQAALERLIRNDRAFPCGCTRKEVIAAGRRGPAGVIYPGTCRDGLPADKHARSWRFRVPRLGVSFEDGLRGPVTVDVAESIGDFIVRRADNLFAYHLAMVVDDAALGVTDVVRGGDLLDSTAPQIVLLDALGEPVPRYLHLPVAVNAEGTKLSKQTGAPAIRAERAADVLNDVLSFLGHRPPAELLGAPPRVQLEWALEQWDRNSLPRDEVIRAPAE
jgi:glutamyl-Q tRNA(Asp) synthetase